MALLNFKHGLLSNMKTDSPAINPGTVYITRDERAMYIDLPPYEKDGVVEAAKRVRIGDLHTFEYLDEMKEAIKNDMTELTTSALYFAEKDNSTSNKTINALLKWNGVEFIQLNEVSEVTANLNELTSRIGEVEDEVDALDAEVTNVKNDLANLTDTTKDTSVAKQIENAVSTLNTNLTSEIEKKADQEDLNALSGELNDYKSANNTAITNLDDKLTDLIDKNVQDISDNAQNISTNASNIATNTEAINTLNGDVNTVGSVQNAVKKEADDRAAAITGVQNQINSIIEKNTQQDTEIGKKVNIAQGSGNNNKVMVTDISGNVTVGAAVADKLTYLSDVTGNIQEQIDDANGLITKNADDIAAEAVRAGGVEQAIIGRVDKLETLVGTYELNEDTTVIDTLEEVVNWIDNDQTGAVAMVTDINNIKDTLIPALETAIDDEADAREAAINTVMGTEEDNLSSNKTIHGIVNQLEWGQF